MDVDVASITMDDAACRSTTTTGATTTGATTGAIGHIGVSRAYQWTSDRTCDLISATALDRIPVGTVNVKPCRRARANCRFGRLNVSGTRVDGARCLGGSCVVPFVHRGGTPSLLAGVAGVFFSVARDVTWPPFLFYARKISVT